MKIYLDCYPCFLKQAIEAARFVTDDEHLVKKIADTVARRLPELPEEATSPVIGGDIHRIVRELTGIEDPYRRVKDENLAEAIKHYPAMKRHVAEAEDPLAEAARVAIAGNIIDYAIIRDYDIEKEIFEIADRQMGINDIAGLHSELASAANVLYLGDNVGETVFDKVLIEEINKSGIPVIYATRGIPVLNDVTLEDAAASGLDEVAELVSSGVTTPGTVLDECSPEFLKIFEGADVIISKGQGNYEALSGVSRPVFFLLRAKCPVVADDLGVELGSMILKGMNISGKGSTIQSSTLSIP